MTTFSLDSNKYIDDLISITQTNIEMTVDADEPGKSSYIRGIMIYFAFEIANERFPFGAGAASYGTVKSDNSNIYADFGLHNSRFFIDKEGIYDSNFASLLGEFGYLGMLSYYLIFIYLCKRINLFRDRKTSPEFFFILLTLMIVYSLTNPVFMNTFQIFTFGLIFVSAKYKTSKQTFMREIKNEYIPG
jgi:hypothetical protein